MSAKRRTSSIWKARGRPTSMAPPSFDRTNYFETLPSNQLELGLWLESDRMGFLLETLDRAKLTNQRDVVRNELRQDEGMPYDLAKRGRCFISSCSLKLTRTMASVIGSHADVEAARLNDVRDFFQHYYTPEQRQHCYRRRLRSGPTLKPLYWRNILDLSRQVRPVDPGQRGDAANHLRAPD